MWRKAHMYFGARPGIESWEDMKGKRIGLLTRGSCPEWFIRGMLVARGLDPDNHLIYVGLHEEYPRIAYVLSEGRIDAGIMVSLICRWRSSSAQSGAGALYTNRSTFRTFNGLCRLPDRILFGTSRICYGRF